MKLFSETYYHGSGAKFSKFDFAFMSTGEGKQVHGWGLYLAHDKDVAQEYRDAVAESEKVSINGNIDDVHDRYFEGFVYGELKKYEPFNKLYQRLFTDDKTTMEYKGLRTTVQMLQSITADYCMVMNSSDNTPESASENVSFECIDTMCRGYKQSHSNVIGIDYMIMDSYDICEFIKNFILDNDVYFISSGMVATVKVSDDCNLIEEDKPFGDIFQLSLFVKDNLFDAMDDWLKEYIDMSSNKPFWEVRYQLDKYMGAEKVTQIFFNSGIDGIHYFGREDGECLVLFNLGKCKIISKE